MKLMGLLRRMCIAVVKKQCCPKTFFLFDLDNVRCKNNLNPLCQSMNAEYVNLKVMLFHQKACKWIYSCTHAVKHTDWQILQGHFEVYFE